MAVIPELLIQCFCYIHWIYCILNVYFSTKYWLIQLKPFGVALRGNILKGPNTDDSDWKCVSLSHLNHQYDSVLVWSTLAAVFPQDTCYVSWAVNHSLVHINGNDPSVDETSWYIGDNFKRWKVVVTCSYWWLVWLQMEPKRWCVPCCVHRAVLPPLTHHRGNVSELIWMYRINIIHHLWNLWVIDFWDNALSAECLSGRI